MPWADRGEGTGKQNAMWNVQAGESHSLQMGQEVR